MIDFDPQDKALILRYRPENAEPDWLLEPIESGEPVALSSRTFFVRKEIYLREAPNSDGPMDAMYQFVVGEKVEGGYYRMDQRVLDIDYDLFLHESLEFKRATFVAETNIPIFRGFQKHGFSSFYIGGDHPDALPKKVFEDLLRQFPTTTELKKYARARVSSMIRSYVPLERDFEAEYTRFRNRKRSAKGSQPTRTFASYETDKFSELVAKLEAMLKRAETYSEAQWQAEILQVVQLLYPKYVAAFSGASVRDSLAGKNREIDFLLVDASGYVDAAEIKQPFAECVVTSTRYRDNHVPMRELNGTVMQLEKYLYHLNRWGVEGEKKLNERYGDKLPAGLTIKIVNPSGLIILGRDEALTADQKADFEVIRRKYRHVVDIMTYDDLLRRLRVIARHFSSAAPAST
jgi:hypothetical protein